MIFIKSKKEIDAMRRGGKILASIMDEIGKLVLPGKNTRQIDQLARRLVFDNGGIPIFEGYGQPPFPATVCASINSEIVHGVPRKDRIIQERDIVKIDIGMKFYGMITDMSRTFPAGKISPEAEKLISVAKESLDRGIEKIRSGASLKDYSRAVESFVEKNGFSVVRDLVGHGVGRNLHEDPQIPNYSWGGKDVVLKEGMTLALEPMVNQGTHRVKLMPDGWAYATADGKLSAHFEDTVLVKKEGCEILTRI